MNTMPQQNMPQQNMPQQNITDHQNINEPQKKKILIILPNHGSKHNESEPYD